MHPVTTYLLDHISQNAERGDNVDGAFNGWSDAWLHPDFRDWNIGDSVAHIRVPIQIIQGGDDVYGSAAQLERAGDEAYCPVDTTLLSNCGHAPHVDQPAKTLDLVTNFMNRLFVRHEEAAPLVTTT